MTDNASITRPDAHDWENVTILSTKVQQFVRPGGHHPPPLGALRPDTCAYNYFTPSYAPDAYTFL